MKKLLIVTSHPIQYNAPLFKLLSGRKKVQVKVFYTWSQSNADVYDPGFQKFRTWDIPLLEGYDYSFIKNRSVVPGSHHFKGIDNPELLKKVDEYDPDAILVFGWSFKSHLKLIRYYKGRKKILFRGDSTLLDEPKGFSVKKIIRKIALTWIYRHVDLVLYVGQANRDYYIKYGLKEDQLIFAPHAIDNARFSEPDETFHGQALQMRMQLGIPGNDLVFLFAGKLEPKKDPEFLIQAFLEINQPGCHLVIAGNGILEPVLKSKYAKIKNLHFLEFQNQSQMPVVYRLGDVVVLPSKGPGETWGLAVNEAMACRKPVLVSDRCGCACDLVKNGANGFVFMSGDMQDLKLKLNQLVQLRTHLPIWGALSYQLIQSWNYENTCTAIENNI